MKKELVAALLLVSAGTSHALVPREDLYQKGGDLRTAVENGFGIVFEVRLDESGALSAETERALDILPGGRKAIVDWQTDDPRALDLYEAAMKRRPAIFEKCHIYVCTNALAERIQGRFIWPRHMQTYRVSDSAVDALGRHRRGEYAIAVRDAAKVHAEITALESGTGGGDALRLTRAVDKVFLPNNPSFSTRESVYARLAEMDAACDSGWRSLTSRAEYDDYRRRMRAKMLEAIGPFPARTPLAFKSLRTVRREGFRVEHVTFESMPGLVVPAYLYVPEPADAARRMSAVVISCGHGEMNYSKYVLAAKDVVQRGMVAFVFEAYDQGERIQYPQYNCCQNHNLTGLKAMLLGSSFAMLRIWDGMRAIDCVSALPYVDKDRIGYMGQSGGGTMTALMMAADPRIKAAAPSGYLTNFGFLCRLMSPQDAEQNIFGQLAFGLNHTGYVLIPDIKVQVTGKYGDFFPYGGSAQMMATVREVAKMLGTENHYAMNFTAGPHSWQESMLQASAVWLSAWLDGRKELLPIDNAEMRLRDFGFDLDAEVDGLTGPESLVLQGKSATALPGARDIHAILRDWFAQAKSARRLRTPEETASTVRRLAGIRMPSESGVRVKEMGTELLAGKRVTRLAFVYPDGFARPAVFVERTDAVSGNGPLLLAGSRGRAVMLDKAVKALAEGRSVLLCDVLGTGEIVRMTTPHYGAYDTPEEDSSIMLYLMGESMVGRRAGDLIAFADWLKKRTGKTVSLTAEGSVSVAAAHAFAAARELFSDVRVENAPPGWSEFLEKPGAPLPYRYTWCVNGALREYDWKDLLK